MEIEPLIGNRPRTMEGPYNKHQVGDRKERIIGQNAGHEIPLEIEDVLDTKKERKKYFSSFYCDKF